MEQKRFPIFSERFALLRGNRTQGEFADFLGISRPTVGFYENGSRIPDALVLRQIAEKCDVSADWLLGLSEAKSINADVQNVCNQTGLSEGIVKFLLNNQGYRQPDSEGFAPIKYFNRFFSPIDFHSFLVALCAYFVDVDAFRVIRHDAEIELTQLQESCNIQTGEFIEDHIYLCCDKWRNEIISQHNEYRYRRFETIDFFTKLLDDVEKRECVQQNIHSIEELCYKYENLDFLQSEDKE